MCLCKEKVPQEEHLYLNDQKEKRALKGIFSLVLLTEALQKEIKEKQGESCILSVLLLMITLLTSLMAMSTAPVEDKEDTNYKQVPSSSGVYNIMDTSLHSR